MGEHPTFELIGREAETELIGAMLDAAPERGSALLLAGDPGIGKSALARHAIEQAAARGLATLTHAAVESEAARPWTGLKQLLAPVLDHADELPEPQRAALAAALDDTAARRADPYLTALAVLGLLGDAGERTPVLVVAEDVHWLDQPTCAALAFVARRLESDRLALLLTTRGDGPRTIRQSRLPIHRVRPLDRDTATRLLAEHAEADALSTEQRGAVLDQAAGNPLALIELPRQASTRSDGLLTLPARLERAFAERASRLPEATANAVLAAALDDPPHPRATFEAAALVTGRPVTEDDLRPAIDAQLVDATLRFRHPLMRSAVQQAATGERRRELHLALAAVHAAEPERALWHRVAASDGPDEQLAGELAELARRVHRRGSVVTAVRTLDRAAALTADEPTRGRRLLDAAELALEIGRTDLVHELLQRTEALDPEDEDRRTWVRDLADHNPLDADQIDALLDRAEGLAVSGDVARASQALLTVGFRLWWARPTRRTRDRVVAATDRILPDKPITGTVVLALVDPIGHGAAVVERIEQLDVDATPPELLRLAAVAAAIVGDFVRAADIARTAITRLTAKGRYGLLAPALVSHAWAHVFLGDWRAGLAVAEQAQQVSLETDQPLWALSGAAAEAALLGLTGDAQQAEEAAQRAERLLPKRGADGMLALVHLARGLTAIAAGREDDARRELTTVLDDDDPGYSAYVACWAIADAADAGAHGTVPVAPGSPWAAAAGAYARGERPGDAFPLLEARALLEHGRRLREAHDTDAARTALRTARDTFDALGAPSLAERARRELRAAGEASRITTGDPRGLLTPQELQIAALVAEGKTNREIGQELYLSHRTVGSHLYRIFPKLGVVSRAELRTALAGT